MSGCEVRCAVDLKTLFCNGYSAKYRWYTDILCSVLQTKADIREGGCREFVPGSQTPQSSLADRRV